MIIQLGAYTLLALSRTACLHQWTHFAIYGREAYKTVSFGCNGKGSLSYINVL